MSDPKSTGIDPNKNQNVRVGNIPEKDVDKLNEGSDHDVIDAKNPEKNKNPNPPVQPKR